MKGNTTIEAVAFEAFDKLKGHVLLKYKRFDKSLPALRRENVKNAGFDLYARLDESVTLLPGEAARIPLNVATEIPNFAVGLLFQRSSTFRKCGVTLTNGVGVVDALYQGNNDEWLAEFQNVSDTPQIIQPGSKLCQAVFLPLLPVILEEVSTLGNPDRGGFGTTGD